jgi:hypothetical protein
MGGFSSAFAAEVAKFEGFGKPNTVPTIANNPGDLELGDIGYGVTSAANGNKITNFPTVDAGIAALNNQTSKMVNGGSSVYNPSMSISQASQLYTGNPNAWDGLATNLGVTPSSPLSSVAGSTAKPVTTTFDSPFLAGVNKVLNYFGAGSKEVNSTDATGGATIANTWLGRGVFIVLGMLLIAAGIFSFSKTQPVIQEFAKGVKEGATAALAA